MVLFEIDDIFSRRHYPTWLAFAFSSGVVNAGAFLACQRFVTHVTGTASRIGVARPLTVELDFLLVLISFIVGAMTSVLLIDGRYVRGFKPLHSTPLFLCAAIIAGVAIAGRYDFFGEFGRTVDLAVDFELLSLLSFASGLQNATVATSTRGIVRTTHMTGPSTDLGINLASLFYVLGESRVAAIRGVLLRGGKLTCFIAGGFVAAAIAPRAGYLVFLLPASVITLATLWSFVLRAPERPAPQRSA